MKRKFTKKLEDWYRNGAKEPLMMIGARQTGKTWVAETFCKQTGRDVISFNFEHRENLDSLFADSLEPEVILKKMEALLERPIDPSRSIFFFDEIQRSERAITSLKYFCESEKDYRIICAGSLLGVKLNRFSTSFPVGKVHLMYMNPMDFEEFLWAASSEHLVQQIRDSYRNMQPLPAALHQKALSLYHDYLYIGGMPQAVNSYLAHGKDVIRFDRDLHRSITTAYLADMRKYTMNASESVKISDVYASLPGQLAKENPKFQYKEIGHGADKRSFQSALAWLKASGIVCEVKRVSLSQSPLKAFTEDSFFKLYYGDVGLLSTAVDLPYREIAGITPGIYRGALTENYVAQSLHALGISLFYYMTRSMEIDYLLDFDGAIIPVEVKAGRHKHSRSLTSYREKHHPTYSFRLSELNFGRKDDLCAVPLYAAFCLDSLP